MNRLVVISGMITSWAAWHIVEYISPGVGKKGPGKKGPGKKGPVKTVLGENGPGKNVPGKKGSDWL